MHVQAAHAKMYCVRTPGVKVTVLSSCRELAGTKRKLDEWDISEVMENEGAIIHGVVTHRTLLTFRA